MQSAVSIVEWRQDGIADLLVIVDYISDHDPNAAQALKNQIETKVSRLPDHPQLYRKGRVRGTREMVIRPNYIVVYSEIAGMITILRVLHAAKRWP